MATRSQKDWCTPLPVRVTVPYLSPTFYARRDYGAQMTSEHSHEPTPEQIRRAPKVLLHDHLDGGLRPGTMRSTWQRETGYEALPENEPDKLGVWFREAADSGSLERYLETFSHTVGVMQTRDALVRVAAECAEDLAEEQASSTPRSATPPNSTSRAG
ncbi:adenosine deaminase OS=Streptomyces antimycoticus OX=68175 GN=SANT12839_042460 PE=3 SV=1 [Streptomyces antimycoticus]